MSKGVKSYVNNDVNSLFKFQSTDNDFYRITTIKNLNWTIGIERGSSSITYSIQPTIIMPDLSKFIPDFNPEKDPEEEEMEEEEIEKEEEDIINYEYFCYNG